MQTKDDIEKHYETPDPWGYQKNAHDLYRLRILVNLAHLYKPDNGRTLDIGAGEGWITGMLPGLELHGLELSDNAAERFPRHVVRVTEPVGKYDLVTAMGILYRHYDLDYFLRLIKAHASKFVLVAGIEASIDAGATQKLGREVFWGRFPYREGTSQLVKVFEVGR